jgi:hypothetical protein
LLLVADPSDLQVFAGTDAGWNPLRQPTQGISVAVFALEVPAVGTMGPMAVASSLPPVHNGAVAEPPAIYTWKRWDKVAFRPYFKKSYARLREIFAGMDIPPAQKPAQ